MSDIHTLAGPYVLHALDETERDTFEQHLSGCGTCATEVAELTETAARLAEDTWSVPPPGLRERVVAQARLTRQLPPTRHPRRRHAPTRWWRHPALATATACLLVAALAAGITYTVQERRVRADRAAAEQLARVQAVLAAPDARLRTAAVGGGGQVTMVAAPSRGSAVVMLAAPSPGADRAYQLWLIRDGVPYPGAVLATGQGTATQLVDGLDSVDALGLTAEPAGGSAVPTLPVLAQLAMG
ncbi:anti-sigma factor [Catellatospora sp. KI3]|uniref:anti-sigma factor n=1 Tax=Catellatospora sp. KI3 TaxID=3041620 RepID=UPI00248289E7|nr:anti-sigma factor [Catellatospora sp. KI3]MDI1460914.1 anti-sigma factor [Catellatospora sp. KI3]